MWAIRETHRHSQELLAQCATIRGAKITELWEGEIVFRHGPEKLREFPGFGDEKLKGRRKGQPASSRLNLQYRVIYAVDRKIVTVYVLEITPHKY